MHIEDQRRALAAYLPLNEHRATPTTYPCVYLAFHPAIGPQDDLIRLQLDDVKRALDTNADCVQRLLDELTRYDDTRHRILGIVFDRSNVVWEVLRLPRHATVA